MKYTQNEIVAVVARALQDTDNRHSKIAYTLTLELLNNVSDNAVFDIRHTTNALNLGDITECIIKYHITDNLVQEYAKAGQLDIARAMKNEVKAFMNSNRYPNALNEVKGFLAISKYGVHYITKSLVAKYWNDERLHIDSKNGKQFTLAILKDMISDGAKLEKRLTEKMLGASELEQ